MRSSAANQLGFPEGCLGDLNRSCPRAAIRSACPQGRSGVSNTSMSLRKRLVPGSGPCSGRCKPRSQSCLVVPVLSACGRMSSTNLRSASRARSRSFVTCDSLHVKLIHFRLDLTFTLSCRPGYASPIAPIPRHNHRDTVGVFDTRINHVKDIWRREMFFPAAIRMGILDLNAGSTAFWLCGEKAAVAPADATSPVVVSGSEVASEEVR